MTGFAQALKTWRQTRRLSQLDLALEARVSSRHISFLETGRAQPSREMVVRISEALHLPLAARNQMMTQAGFAARYVARDWQGNEMAPIRSALSYMLTRHDPYPAIAADRYWTVLEMNRSATLFFGLLGVGVGDSMLDLVLGDRLPRVVENWPQVAYHFAHRLRTESAALGGDARLSRVAEALTASVPSPTQESLLPVVPTIYRADGHRLSLFSTFAQFGTPEDLVLEHLKIELFFPADAATEAALRGETP
jgi:transcriptional regulator with XRE-family HTH domain